MSKKEVEHTHLFNYPWEIVVRAYLGKYPHPRLSHVESIDTLERYVDEKGCLVTTRIITSSFLKFSSAVGLEQSYVDLSNKKLELFTQNITHTKFSCIEELCTYVPSGDSTHYKLQGTISAGKGMGIFIGKLLSTVQSNFKKGTEVIEDIVQNKIIDKKDWAHDLK